MSKIEKRRGGFTKDKSIQRIVQFLEPVFIFRYCTRYQLIEYGKDILGFLSVRWLVEYCVKSGYLTVFKDKVFKLDVLYLTSAGKNLIKLKSQIEIGCLAENRNRLIARYRFDKRGTNMVYFRHHDLLVSGYLNLYKQIGIKSYISEWLIRGKEFKTTASTSTKKGIDAFKVKIIPDGIIECENFKIAVEAETVRRRLDRWKTTLEKYYEYTQRGVITRYQLEEAEVNWHDIFQKLLKNGWAKEIDLTHMRLTVDLAAENSRMTKIFGDVFNKILPILELSAKRNVQGVLIIAGNNTIYESIRNRIFLSFPEYRDFSMKAIAVTTLDMLKGVIAKSKIAGISGNGVTVLNRLVEKGILEEVSSTEVRLSAHKYLEETEIKAIAKNDFERVWFVLGQSLKEGKCFYHNMLTAERLAKVNHIINGGEYQVLNRQKIRKGKVVFNTWTYNGILQFKKHDKEEDGLVLGNEIRISEAIRLLKEVKYENEKSG